jgi:hypothetical protein
MSIWKCRKKYNDRDSRSLALDLRLTILFLFVIVNYVMSVIPGC